MDQRHLEQLFLAARKAGLPGGQVRRNGDAVQEKKEWGVPVIAISLL